MCESTRTHFRLVSGETECEAGMCIIIVSLWLFNVYMDHIMREAKEGFSGGVKLEDRNVQFLLFAEDVMLVAEKEEDVERNLSKYLGGCHGKVEDEDKLGED